MCVCESATPTQPQQLCAESMASPQPYSDLTPRGMFPVPIPNDQRSIHQARSHRRSALSYRSEPRDAKLHVYAGSAGNKVKLKGYRCDSRITSEAATLSPSLMLPSLGIGARNIPHPVRNFPMVFLVCLLWQRKVNRTPHGTPDLTLQEQWMWVPLFSSD